MRISGKVAVVTGAASGLGRATAAAFSRAGAAVVGLDREADVSDDGGPATPSVELKQVDITNGAAVQAAFTEIQEQYGQLHICVNAAGVATAAKTVSDSRPMTREMFRQVMEVNLIGAYDVMRQSAELMRRGEGEGEDAERGVIINVSSGAAFQGQRGQVAYSASKAGLIGMMLPAARDLGQFGIRVLTIAPGLFMTAMAAGLPDETIRELEQTMVYPSRLGDPSEFAQLACSLVENPYINAETVGIDAGIRMT